MKPTVYIETTIVSYLTAWPSRDKKRLSDEKRTREWWDRDRAAFDIFTSQFTWDEAAKGDAAAATQRLEALRDVPLLLPHAAAVPLAERLVIALAIPEKSRIDASHVAISAVHGISYLLTWNCRHLANPRLEDRIVQTCADAGFVAPRILTPDDDMRQRS